MHTESRPEHTPAQLLDDLQRARLRFVEAVDAIKARPVPPHRHGIARVIALYTALQRANARAEAHLAAKPAEAGGPALGGSDTVTPFPVGPDQIWYEVHCRPAPGTRALFLDRDGVIIRDRHYLRDPDGVELLDGIVAIMQAAQTHGVPCVVVTNQSGIGRGLFGWPDFYAVQERMLADLGRAGVAPAAVLACPHHPEAQAPYRLADPPMRKPNPGMILRAAESLGLSAAESLMIGDKADDMAAAAAAGLHAGILVGGGEATVTTMPVHRAATVRDALEPVVAWLAAGAPASRPRAAETHARW